MNVYAKKWIPLAAIVVGVCLLAFIVIGLVQGIGSSRGLIGAVLLIGVGTLILKNPAIRYQNKQLEFYNPLGMRLKAWDLKDLSVEENANKTVIMARKANGKMKKVFAAPNFGYDDEQSKELIDVMKSELVFD